MYYFLFVLEKEWVLIKGERGDEWGRGIQYPLDFKYCDDVGKEYIREGL